MHTEVKRALRVAHITDCHLYNDQHVISKMQKLFQYLHSVNPRPDIIINTGDTVLDANFEKFEVVEESWKTWKLLTANVSIPIHSLLGNHDIWIPPFLSILSDLKNPFMGKNLALKMLNLSRPYYSFELHNWKFIGLNSTAKRYALGKEQFTWLSRELEHTNLPVCIFSHVPVLSVASYMYHLKKKRWWPFPVREMHSDTLEIQQLFNKHKNVKVCLSGHVHFVDDVLYKEVRYLCNGAVCGNWWKSEAYDFPPVFGIIDLFEDGGIEKQVVDINSLYGKEG